MANDGKQSVYIKDLRPGMKNLHMVFIVLEIGKKVVYLANSLPRVFLHCQYERKYVCVHGPLYERPVSTGVRYNAEVGLVSNIGTIARSLWLRNLLQCTR